MDIFVKKFQPEKYENWINKTDIAPHPMDPPEVAKSKNPPRILFESFKNRKSQQKFNIIYSHFCRG